ncbi:uncharacterized protein FOMMEDRAFT_24361, partial [Fomitiporia mediterranea MF3/22]
MPIQRYPPLIRVFRSVYQQVDSVLRCNGELNDCRAPSSLSARLSLLSAVATVSLSPTST